MTDHTRNVLTHIDAAGEAHMVDVSDKPITVREAEARARVVMQVETARLIAEDRAAKGDVLGTARIAGIMAAKRTPDVIPLCHGLPLSSITVDLSVVDSGAVEISARVKTESRTGVEMEALTAVTVAALTIYDMCKAVDRGMSIENIRVTHKSGGRSGTFQRD